jgi:hypothetical protein
VRREGRINRFNGRPYEEAEHPEWHDWDGCVCKKYGMERDEQHDWGGDLICKKCGSEI